MENGPSVVPFRRVRKHSWRCHNGGVQCPGSTSTMQSQPSSEHVAMMQVLSPALTLEQHCVSKGTRATPKKQFPRTLLLDEGISDPARLLWR